MYNAHGSNNAHKERNRAVCRVYTNGTGEEYIFSQMAVHSPRMIMDLSVSMRALGSDAGREWSWMDNCFQAAVARSGEFRMRCPMLSLLLELEFELSLVLYICCTS